MRFIPRKTPASRRVLAVLSQRPRKEKRTPPPPCRYVSGSWYHRVKQPLSALTARARDCYVTVRGNSFVQSMTLLVNLHRLSRVSLSRQHLLLSHRHFIVSSVMWSCTNRSAFVCVRASCSGWSRSMMISWRSPPRLLFVRG